MVSLKLYREQNNRVFEDRRNTLLEELETYAEYVKELDPNNPIGINTSPYDKDLIIAFREFGGAIATSQQLWFMEHEEK